MKKIIVLIASGLLIFTSCQKKSEETPSSPNMTSQIVSNLGQVSSTFTPASLASVSTSNLKQQSDPCANTSDWAVCQSNLIREYVKIGKSTVETISNVVSSAGSALGNIQDGSSGTSENGKISWNKTSSTQWSVLVRGTSNASTLYVSIANNVYTLKVDGSTAESNPSNMKAEATVTYTDSATWTVDVFFYNETCSSDDVGAPSRVNIKLAKANGLWTGKSMLYSPRWKKPNTTVTCNTTAGTNEIALYTDFVGNDTSTKASLYITGAISNFVSSPSSFELIDICTNFPSGVCNVTGGPASGGLTQAAYGNPFCTTGPNTVPTWNNSCTTNATVNSASYSTSADWIEPATLKTKSVTLPTSL